MSFGSLILTVTSPVQTFAEPVTLAEARAWLELPEFEFETSPQIAPDSDRNAMIESLISAARHQAEIQEDKDLVRKQWDLHLDSFYDCDSFVDYWSYAGAVRPRGPLVSVDLVRYRDSDGNYTTLTEDTDYIVDIPRALILPTYGNSWPSFTEWPSSAVLIRFTSGYAPEDAFWNDAGKSIKLGMRYLISAWFNNRLPFESGNKEGISEYPWTVSALLRSVPRVG